MKNLFTSLVLLFFALNAGWAQSTVKGTVSGTIRDISGNPMEFVTVMLLNSSDSSLVKGAVSEPTGKYLIENVSEGGYYIAATQVGYQKIYSKKFFINPDQSEVVIPDLLMEEDIKLLKEITVETTRPFIEQEIDRMVINVENSIVSSGNNALEVLEKAPGVTIDRQNDQIQLKGKQGVIILIDGKQTYLSGQDLSNLLRNTQSDNIEKIEVITNPSSKYDAAGNTGIINIRMKKNKNYGTNGTAVLGTGMGRYEKANGSLQLNHRVGKINAFGNYSYNYNKSFQTNEISRVIRYNDNITYFDQFSNRPNKFDGHSYRGGLDYFISKKSTLGVLVTGFFNEWQQFNALNQSVIRDENQNVILKPDTEVSIKNPWTNFTGNLNYKYDFNGQGHELTVDGDYSRYDRNSVNNLTTTFRDVNDQIVQPTEEVRNTMPSLIDIYALKADYVLPFKNGRKLEAGIKSSYIKSDNNLVFETLLDNRWNFDPTRSNHFKYSENINAAYVNYGGKISEKTTIQMGLRVEQTHSEGNSVTLNQVVDRNYINLFPTFFLSRQIDSSNVLNFSYSRRIDRPNYQSLNPFIFYLDPYTYQQGNPYLQPQLTHSVQLVHSYKNTISTTLGYSHTSDVIIHEVPGQIPEKNITYVQAQNMATQDNVNLSVSYPVKIKNWWNIQNNFTVFYNRLTSPYLGEQFNLDVVAYNAYISNNFVLGKGFTAELAGWYNSKSFYGLFINQPMGAFSLGLQKQMLDKKLTIKANVNDPFWLNRFRGKVDYQDLKLSLISSWESRVARLTLTYNFGNQNVKGARQRSTSTEAERNRAGGSGN